MSRNALGDPGVQLYTAHNLWYEHPQRMWSTGYKKGAIVPAGTAITNLTRSKKWMKFYILFVVPQTRVQHGILWMPNHHPGVTLEGFVRRTFTEKTFEQLVEGFSEAEIAAVRRGEVEPGMSRRAALVSWGFPPEVGTANLEVAAWKYWIHRFHNGYINFEGDAVASVTR
jgi:hypothetical protein